ncbi:MAG: LUD domain-containing protein [Clostridiales bacterium]|nr:LUD domain-containing protein [Clostridiales bacterium]
MDVRRAMQSLEQRGFAVRYFETAREAAEYLVGSISGKTVGIGGSVTIEQLDIFDRLQEQNTVYWHWKQSDPQTRALATGAEVYLTSANAIAETGEIINIDGSGNRVAATLFDHERVVFVAGVNKLAPDLESAMYRARNVAAPLNARRLKFNTPCAVGKEMKCYDCASKDRICSGIVTIVWPMRSIKVTEVVLIGESLGY